MNDESEFEEEFIPLDFDNLSFIDWVDEIHKNFHELRKRRKPRLSDS